MRKILVFGLVVALVVGAMPLLASAQETEPIPTETIVYGDVTLQGPVDGMTFPELLWDLSQCDLTVSYIINLSDVTPPDTPDIEWNTPWTYVGIMDSDGAAIGWMSSGTPGADITEPESPCIYDKHVLGAPGREDELSYDALDADTVVEPFGTDDNEGIWFERTQAEPEDTDGDETNPPGVHEIAVIYHAIVEESDAVEDGPDGTVFATVNGFETLFRTVDWTSGDEPPPIITISPAGKSIVGDLTQVQVFVSLVSRQASGETFEGSVVLSGITFEGCPQAGGGGELPVSDLPVWDLILLTCDDDPANHGEFVSCTAHLTNEFKWAGIITGREKGEFQSRAAKADVPPGKGKGQGQGQGQGHAKGQGQGHGKGHGKGHDKH